MFINALLGKISMGSAETKSFKMGIYVGFVGMFIIFSTILFFVLKLFNHLPDSWTYFHIFLISLPILFIGAIMRKWVESV